MTREALISRLEKATGPDRELDAEIAKFLGWTIGSEYYVKSPDGKAYGSIPKWTSSIDAAMTLVPEGWSWKLVYETEESGVYRVVMRNAASLAIIAPANVVRALTPALALCVAALKSREVQP